MYERRKRSAYKPVNGSPKKKRCHLQELSICERILQWIFEKEDVRVWVGFNRLGIRCSGGFL
jgi:hypothetical protein